MKISINERAVLQLIGTGQATSQIQLARALQVRPPTVHGIVKRLEKSGLLTRDRTDRGKPGRPIQHFQVKRQGVVLAIEWLGSHGSAGVFRDDQLQGSIQRMDSPPVNNLDAALRYLRKIRDAALAQARLAPSDLAGAVLSLNALRAARERVFSSSVIPWIRQVSEQQFSDALGCECQFDLRAGWVVHELRARAAEKVSCLVDLSVGDGVSAHWSSVDLQWGSERQYRGELGHVVIDPKGPICGCGHRGCLEAWASGPALRKRVDADVKSGIQTALAQVADQSPRELFSQLEALHLAGTDSYASTMAEEFLDRMAWCVSWILNVIGPEVIMLSGYGLEGRESWRQRIIQKARAWTLYGETADIRLEFPRLKQQDYLRELARSFKGLPIHAVNG